MGCRRYIFWRYAFVTLLFITFLIAFISPSYAVDAPWLSDIKLSSEYTNVTDGGVDIGFETTGMENALVTVAISNSSGVIRQYVYHSIPAGHYQVHWNCRDSRSYLIEDGNYTVTVNATSNNIKYVKSIDRYYWPDKKPGESSFSTMLPTPVDVEVNSSGYMYLSTNGGIFVFDPDGTCVKWFQLNGNGICMDLADMTFIPSYFITIDKYGNQIDHDGGSTAETVFVDAAVNSTGFAFIMGSDVSEGRFVRLYSPGLQYIRTIAGKDVGPAGFKGWCGMAVNSSDFVFVTEAANRRVSIFSPDGSHFGQIATSPYAPGFVAFDCFDNMYITSQDPPAILFFSPDGWMTVVMTDLSESGNFGPAGIAPSPDGRIYVCDMGIENVKVFFKGFFKQSRKVTVDRVPPEAIVNASMDGVTDFNVNAPVTAGFNEAINPGSLNANTFLLNGGSVSGMVFYDPAIRMARFEPAVGLRPNSTYTVTLTTGICDAAGNHMAANNTWSFTTGAVATPGAYSSPTPGPAATTPVSTPAGAEWLLLTAIAIGGAGYASWGRRRA